MSAATDQFRAQLEDHEAIRPGTVGWWRVWGANTRHIGVGDIIVTCVDHELVLDEVAQVRQELCVAVVTTADGDVFRFGHLYRAWHLFRRSTHNMLAS